MQRLSELMLAKAKEILDSGKADRVIGWKQGDFYYDVSPATFTKDNLDGFVYNSFCGANLSKYLVGECKKEGKIAIFLKPCDSYSFNQLVSEHRIDRDRIWVVAIECQGKLDVNKLYEKDIEGITDIVEDGDNLSVKTIYGDKTATKDDVMLLKCTTFKSKVHAVKDEEIILNEMHDNADKRVDEVEKLSPGASLVPLIMDAAC